MASMGQWEKAAASVPVEKKGDAEAAASVPVEKKGDAEARASAPEVVEEDDEFEEEEEYEEEASSPSAVTTGGSGAKAVRHLKKATASAPEVVEEEGKEKDVKYRRRIEAMRAVKEDGLRLKNCSSKLRGDKVVVLEAVKQNGWAFEHCSESLRNDKDVAREARTSFTAVALRASLLPLTQAALCPEGHLLTANFYSVTYHSRICRTCGATGTDWSCSACNYDVCSACRCESLKSGAVESIAVPDDFVTLLVSALGAKGRSEGAENMVLEAKEARGILPAVALWSCLQSLQHPRLCKQGHPLKADSCPDMRCHNRCGMVGTNWMCSDCHYVLCSACHCRVPTTESVAVPVDFVNRVVSALGATGCSDAQEDLVFESTNRQALQHWLQHNLPDVCKLLAEALRNNKDLAAEVVKRNGWALGLCSETLRNDEDVAIEAIKRNGEALKYCSEELKNRKDLALEALKSCSAGEVHSLFGILSKETQSNYDVALMALKSCSAEEVHSLFGILSKETQSNYDVALMALRSSSGDKCYKIFKSLAEQLQNDKTLRAIEAIKSLLERAAYDRFKTLSKEMQNNKEVAMTALERSRAYADDVFKLLSKDLQNSKEVAMQALKSLHGSQVCNLFKQLSMEMQNNKEVAMTAVKNQGGALQYCSDTLRNDKDVCTEALKSLQGSQVCDLFKQLSMEMQNNKEVAMTALANVSDGYVPEVFQLISKELQNNEEVAMQALKAFLGTFEYISAIDRNDKRFVLEAVKRNGRALQFCSEPLRNDKDVATEAVKQNGNALQYCSKELRGDKDVVMEAARKSTTALKFALNALNQDVDCLKAAGFWGESRAAFERRLEKGILSVKFGFSEQASNLSTVVAEKLAKHPEMCKFEIYNPNLYCKKSCDPNFTDLNWACRGTATTCMLEQKRKTTDVDGKPTKESCWRLSFQLHQKMCKETGGFMLQLEEQGKLGAGQEIETLMAKDLDLKIFRVKWGYPESLVSAGDKKLVNQIADTVLDWFADKQRDTRMQIIKANLWYESKRFGKDW